MDRFEIERLAVELWRCDLSVAVKFPRKDVGEVLVIAQRFAFGRLMFFAKMRAARFIARERVQTHELGEFEKICDTTGPLQRLVEIFAIARHSDFAPKSFA